MDVAGPLLSRYPACTPSAQRDMTLREIAAHLDALDSLRGDDGQA